jgi:hypothetical protein
MMKVFCMDNPLLCYVVDDDDDEDENEYALYSE